MSHALFNRVHILGASASGTTTLAKAMAERFSYEHLDTDDFFWEPTDPPCQHQRDVEVRTSLLDDALSACPRWVLSGSLCGWGDVFIPLFDLVIFLRISSEVRIARLKDRERQRFGEEIEPGGRMYEQHIAFVSWAEKYDDGPTTMRSRKKHERWLSKLPCRFVRFEGIYGVDEQLRQLKPILTEL